jgi:hypothetical protein
MIAALYVERGGVYYGLPDVDPWDEERDARKYAGPWPVVAHPPCERWSQLARLCLVRYGYKIGDDHGTFAAALASVRRWGGVLEHPAETMAWKAHGLIDPSRQCGWQKCIDGGWVCQVSQVSYGHKARKATWLYCFRCTPPSMDWRDGKGEYVVTTFNGETRREMPKKERKLTPIAFRDVLLSIARSAR